MTSAREMKTECIHEINRLTERVAELEAFEKQCAVRTAQFAESQKRLLQEVEDHRRTEHALLRSEQKFRQLFDGAPIAYLSLSLSDESVLNCNDAALQLLGYNAKSLMQAKLLTLFVDAATIGSILTRLRRGEPIRDVETEIRHRNGHSRWVGITAEPLRDSDGRVSESRFMLVDISERKEAEAKLKAAHEALEKEVAQRTTELQALKDRLQEENIFLRAELQNLHAYGDIIGEAQSLKNVIHQIDLVAPTDANVLILGESGTGKELVAREIHRHSRRRSRPMIKVNCAVIPRELYESEFFGHAKGAFTGATRDRAGRFEAADGGTLFLDEVAEIPPELQGKLLRVLQENEYERLGEEKTRKVDVRIIASTNQDLKAKVNKNLFRQDLYYRLNVFPIEIPPLRSRKEDIRPLTEYFLHQVAQRMNRPHLALTRANLNLLNAYDWPGNVRELQNAVERAVILARSGKLRFDLPAGRRGPDEIRPRGRPVQDVTVPAVLTDTQIKAFQRENMLAALKQCGWKIYGRGGAAELLEIKPTTLTERMKKVGITRPGVSRQPAEG